MSEHPPPLSELSAVILAGGRGTRMNGADKGLLELAGRPLVMHVQEALAPQVGTVLINANRHLDRYRQLLPAAVCADRRPDFEGPLAGIEAGFAASQSPWLLAAPCDTPGLPPDLLAQLWAGLHAAGAPAAYALGPDGPVYPLCLLSRALAPALSAALDAGERAVGRWLQAQGAVAVAVQGWRPEALNLNTPGRLQAAEAIIRQ